MPGTPHYPKDLGDVISQMQRDQRSTRTASQSRVGYDKVAKGSLTVINDDGQEIAKFGYFGNIGPDQIFGTVLHRADGTEAMRFYSSASGANTFSALLDKAGNFIWSDDFAGQGIGAPHIPLGPLGVSANAQIAPVFWPRTTSTTMVTLLEGYLPALQPRIRAIVYGYSDTGTNGELDVLVNGTSILGGTTAIPTNNFSNPTAGPYQIPGWGTSVHFGDEIHLEIACRKITGSGSVYVQCLGLYGTGS